MFLSRPELAKVNNSQRAVILQKSPIAANALVKVRLPAIGHPSSLRIATQTSVHQRRCATAIHRCLSRHGPGRIADGLSGTKACRFICSHVARCFRVQDC
jgi:hypothetical protein